MRRLPLFNYTSAVTAPCPPAPRQAAPAEPQPRDEMWRSRRVLSGSDWMAAWVRKPTKR
jgi:hypothetical protein